MGVLSKDCNFSSHTFLFYDIDNVFIFDGNNLILAFSFTIYLIGEKLWSVNDFVNHFFLDILLCLLQGLIKRISLYVVSLICCLWPVFCCLEICLFSLEILKICYYFSYFKFNVSSTFSFLVLCSLPSSKFSLHVFNDFLLLLISLLLCFRLIFDFIKAHNQLIYMDFMSLSSFLYYSR